MLTKVFLEFILVTIVVFLPRSHPHPAPSLGESCKMEKLLQTVELELGA